MIMPVTSGMVLKSCASLVLVDLAKRRITKIKMAEALNGQCLIKVRALLMLKNLVIIALDQVHFQV